MPHSSQVSNEPDALLVDDALRELSALLGSKLKPSIKLAMRLRAPGVAIAATAADLRHIVLTLAENAQEALPEGGQLRFSTSVRFSKEGRMVRLECSDTGSAFSLASLRALFTEGARTKRRGTVHGMDALGAVVRRFGGRLEVMQRPRGGAVFAITLPPVDEAPADSKA